MSELRPSPAVYGIETEYSVLVTLPGNVVHELVGSCHSVDAKLGIYIQPQHKGTKGIASDEYTNALEAIGIRRNTNGMLSNGGRFYIDPSGPEYDTPETTTAEEAVLRCFDGDEILLHIFHKLRRDGTIDGFQLNRRVVDHNRTSRGIHLNTFTNFEAGAPPTAVTSRLAALNVVKGSLFGSGGLLVDEQGETHFHHSPRLSITNDISSGSYTRRPLVRLPFKADGNYGRIETITSDALSFAWPLKASLVLTNEVVALLEMQKGDELPVLRDPIRAARAVGRYGSKCQVAVVQEDGTNIGRKPLDVIRDICERIMLVHEKEDHLSAESVQTIAEIVAVADRMSEDSWSVVKEVESVARLGVIREKMSRSGKGIDSPQLCRFDYLWDMLDGGIAERYRKERKAGWLGFAEEPKPKVAMARLVNPPQDTRAKLRGEIIASGQGDNINEWYEFPQLNVPFGHTSYMHPLEIS